MIKKNVLIIENESIIAMCIKKNLIYYGYNVIDIIPDGEKALDAINKKNPDCVLMDVVLNGNIDGIETAEKIEKDYHVPVVFLTGNSDEETMNRVNSIKHYGLIFKPFSISDLNVTIKNAINAHSLNEKKMFAKIY